MDVRDLAPALLALGQLLDAANANINGDAAHIKLEVRAAEKGSFQIALDLVQHWNQVLSFFATPEVSGATNLLTWVLGLSTTGTGLFWLVKKLHGKTPDSAEKLPNNTIRIVIESETIIVPLEVMRLYQDISVRNAAQKVVEEPLKKDGIDTFEVRKAGEVRLSVTKYEAAYFARPVLSDEVLIDETRRAAFSIISLAFKEDNKWRLYDGNTQISAGIEDPDFLARVNSNQISFSKGDILICDVHVRQIRTADGLKTDYVVEKVIQHRPAARQLPLSFSGS